MTNPLRPNRVLRVFGACLCILLLLAPSTALFAEGVEVSLTDLEADWPELTLDIVDGVLRLDLQDAIAIALQRNLALSVQRHLRRESQLSIAEALGIYDFTLAAFGQLSTNVSPIISTLVDTGGAAQKRDQTQWSTSLSRLFPVGGTASLTFNGARTEDNDARQAFNPVFNEGLDLRYQQPLLRGFGRTATEQQLLVARINSTINRESFDLEVQRVVQEIGSGYWSLVEAREQLRVAEESLGLAKELHQNNKIQVEVGTLPPLETVNSEAGIARSQNDIIGRRGQLQDAEDVLRRLLNLDQGALWDTPIEPTTAAEMAFIDIDVDQAIATTLERRSDLKRKTLEIESAQINHKVAKNGLKPQLDLDASYGFNGIGGRTDLGNGAIDPGGFSDALNQILDRNFEGWSASLSFSYPIRNQAAKARYATSELALDRNRVEYTDLEQSAITSVRRLARAVRTAAEQIESARVSSRLQRKNLEAEQKRYENGLSNSFRILEIQQDLSQALRDEVSAIVGYRQALVLFYNGTGELLEKYGINLVDE